MKITQKSLQNIRDTKKSIDTSQKHSKQKGIFQWNFDVEVGDFGMSEISIKIFARQNVHDEGNFSCGIFIEQNGKKITLSCYNGSNHENEVASYECHIHTATVESINNDDRKPEHDDIQVTSRYNNLDEAFRCLCEDYNVYMSEKISMSKQNLFGWSLQ